MNKTTVMTEPTKANVEEFTISVGFFVNFFITVIVMLFSIAWFFGRLKQRIDENSLEIQDVKNDVFVELKALKEDTEENRTQLKELQRDIKTFIKDEIVRSENNVINSLTASHIEQKMFNKQVEKLLKDHDDKINTVDLRMSRIGEDAREAKIISKFLFRTVAETTCEEMATGSVKKSTMSNEKNVITLLGLDNEL